MLRWEKKKCGSKIWEFTATNSVVVIDSILPREEYELVKVKY